jgi:hypothetical protein
MAPPSYGIAEPDTNQIYHLKLLFKRSFSQFHWQPLCHRLIDRDGHGGALASDFSLFADACQRPKGLQNGAPSGGRPLAPYPLSRRNGRTQRTVTDP